jgi:hypothetical protein
MSPAVTKTAQVFVVALFAFILGPYGAKFGGSGFDWAVLILSAIAMVLSIISLTLGFWKSNA